MNSVQSSIQLTMEKEQNDKLPLLDVLVACTEQGFRSSVYHKITFTRQNLNFNCHHQYNMKNGIVCCLQHRAKVISSDTGASQEEMISLRQPPLQQLPRVHNIGSKKPGYKDRGQYSKTHHSTSALCQKPSR